MAPFRRYYFDVAVVTIGHNASNYFTEIW